MAKLIRHIKYNHYKIAFYTCLLVSIALIVGGFFAPPMGEIHGSVLTAVGLLFLYPTLEVFRKALDSGRKASISTGNIEINVEGKE